MSEYQERAFSKGSESSHHVTERSPGKRSITSTIQRKPTSNEDGGIRVGEWIERAQHALSEAAAQADCKADLEAGKGLGIDLCELEDESIPLGGKPNRHAHSPPVKLECVEAPHGPQLPPTVGPGLAVDLSKLADQAPSIGALEKQSNAESAAAVKHLKSLLKLFASKVGL